MNNENANDRIILDFGNVSTDIESILNEVNAMRSGKLFSKSLGANSVQKVKDNCALIKKRLSDAFNIVVIGDFKRGKSTLINALIGEDIVPTAVTPETVTINRISYSETPKVEAVLKNGKKAMLSYNELKREAIEKIMEELPSEIDYINVEASAEILKEITIVDTPGVGDLVKAFDEKVANFLVNADAVIYTISARSPLSMTERTFLSSVVMPQSFSRIFAVVNMADTLETEENINNIAALTKERLLEVSPDLYVYTISALDEICRRKNVKRPAPELASVLENNFLEFETALNNDIILQKDIIKSIRAVSLTRIMLDDIANRIMLIKNLFQTNAEKLSSQEQEFKDKSSALMKEIESKKTALASAIDGMKQEAENWIREFLTRLLSEINSIGSSVTMSDLERHFQFYMSDSIKNAVISCVETHQKDIADRVAELSKTMSDEITKNAFGSIDTKIAGNITDLSWTKVDTALYWGDFFGAGNVLGNMLGGWGYVVGQVIGGFVRQGVINKKQSDFLAPIINSFDSVKNDVINSMDTVYDKLKLSTMEMLQETFQSQIETSLEAIEQAKQIALDESVKTEEVVEYLDSVLSDLEEQKKVVEKYE